MRYYLIIAALFVCIVAYAWNNGLSGAVQEAKNDAVTIQNQYDNIFDQLK